MHKLRSERGFFLSGILLGAGAILVMGVMFVIVLRSFLSSRSLAWRSDFQKGCSWKSPDVSNKKSICGEHIYQYDSGDNLVNIVTHSGYNDLYSISKDTGNLIWNTSVLSAFYKQDGSIYPNNNKDSFKSFNNKIYLFGISRVTALSSDTGEQINSVIFPFHTSSDAVLEDEKFLIVSDEGKLYEIDPETLSYSQKGDLPYWDKEIPKMKVDGNIIYYIGDPNQDQHYDSKFMAFDFVNKKLIWAIDNVPQDLGGSPMDDKYIYVFSNDQVFALNKEAGELAWSIHANENNPRMNSNPMLIALSKNNIVAAFDDKINVLDKYSGNVVNSFPEDGEVASALKIDNDIMYILYINLDHAFDGVSKSWVVAQDINTGKEIAKFSYGKTGIDSIFSDPIIGDSYIYAICRRQACAFKKPQITNE